MIGQKRVQERIKKQIDSDRYPNFVILVAPRGSGKSLLTAQIVKWLNAQYVEFKSTVEDIRKMIESAYTYSIPTVYSIRDIDFMSQSAFNTLLKVVEEPPKFVNFIFTCENINNIPNTIRSRAVTYMLEPYSEDELLDFCETQNIHPDDSTLDIADTPGDLLLLNATEGLIDFVNLVILNIATVSGSNAFKIADRINIKGDDPTKFDLKLFWKAFSVRCLAYMMVKDIDNSLQFGKAVNITNDAISELNIRGRNRGMLFDEWLLKVRSEWM